MALCGELALEEAMDLSKHRLRNEWMNEYVHTQLSVLTLESKY